MEIISVKEKYFNDDLDLEMILFDYIIKLDILFSKKMNANGVVVSRTVICLKSLYI